jgi:hypothetical protein
MPSTVPSNVISSPLLGYLLTPTSMLWLRGRDPGPRLHKAIGLSAAVDLENWSRPYQSICPGPRESFYEPAAVHNEAFAWLPV